MHSRPRTERSSAKCSRALCVGWFVASDNVVEETAASATGGVSAALAELALLCHVEHAERSILA